MATFDDVNGIAAALDGVSIGTSYRNRAWNVGKKSFAWERPLSKADVKRFGPVAPPDGPLLAVAVADLEDKEAILAIGHAGVFTIEHFNGYPAVLIELDVVHDEVLRELIIDAWLAVAPERAVRAYLERTLPECDGALSEAEPERDRARADGPQADSVRR